MLQEEVITKAKLISVVRNYTRKRTASKDKHVDFTVSPCGNNEKILMRAITETKTKSGYVGLDTVRKMVEFLKKKQYDKGILIGKKFTSSAKKEIMGANIELISDNFSPQFKLERLYSTINSYVEKICRKRCGKIPTNDSDCKGFDGGNYSCQVRLISDNADFHYKKTWKNFLKKDLIKLMTIEKSGPS